MIDLETVDFEEFPKIPRLSRECIISEKIDGTNACIYIGTEGLFLTGSRTRWITPENDNFGFSRWAYAHKGELIEGLGYGLHRGEWWGSGIQRGYGLTKGEKRFSLFNTSRWNNENIPLCVFVVPVLYTGIFESSRISEVLTLLQTNGSTAAPGFMQPEGVVIYHTAAGIMFKKSIEKDDEPKRQGE